MNDLYRKLARLSLCGSLLLVASSCAKRGGPPPAHPVTVQTAPAVKMDAPVILTGFGSTSERASVDIVPQVSGLLLKRYFEDGAIVTNGQPLFLIDPSDYESRVRQAESMLDADRANRDLARVTLDRNRTLLVQQLIAQSDFDTLQTHLDAAIAQVKGDESALDQARLNLSRCRINAPLDGVCSKHLLDEGNLAAAGLTRLTNIRSYTPINVDFALSEEYLATIRRALQTPPVRLEVKPRGDTNMYEGTLVFMDNAVSTQTGTIALRGEIPNRALNLWADQFVDVHVQAGMVRDAVMVPEGAVQFGKMGTFLYAVTTTNYLRAVTNEPPRQGLLSFGARAAPVIAMTNIVESVATLRAVHTGVRYNDLIQVFGNVAPGERVVVLGQFTLYPGATVVEANRIMPVGVFTNQASLPAKQPDRPASERSAP